MVADVPEARVVLVDPTAILRFNSMAEEILSPVKRKIIHISAVRRFVILSLPFWMFSS